MKNNSNAFIGKNVEELFRQSIADYLEVTKTIAMYFKLNGHFTQAINTGLHGEKVDVKLAFSCGHNIDANIKAYKNDGKNKGFNQLTRTSVAKFSETFTLNQKQREDLESIIIKKSLNPSERLFNQAQWNYWHSFFKEKTPSILKWCFAYKPSREILVLFDRTNDIFHIYSMKKTLEKIPKELTHTKGGFNIGECVSFQRKGGNGSLKSDWPKNHIKHPGNNIQLKLKCDKFIKTMETAKITQYALTNYSWHDL